jgi:hypothetical protein
MDDIHILKAKRLDCMMRKTGLAKKNGYLHSEV